MDRRNVALLILILLLSGLALYVDLDVDHPAWFENLQFWRPEGGREIAVRYGLDLRGGLKVLLAADIPEGQAVDPVAMETARQIVENRVNGLGLTEPVVQAQGDRRIIVELPGIEDPELAVEAIRGTALLEFIDAGYTWLPEGTVVRTTLGGPSIGKPTTVPTATPALVPTPGVSIVGPITPTSPLTPTAEVTPTAPVTPTTDARVYETVLTGAGLKQVGLDRSQTNEYQIPFELYPDAAATFAEYTASHVGQYLCIVLDKEVISCPVIRDAIPDGRGTISLGSATYQEARSLAIQLHYGALPVPLRVETISTVGPTLGEISVERSIRAGIIGLSIVLLFMLIYYRLPGGLADVALVIYALLNLALYKLLPVTLTFPGIAGFLLSAGMAVDANILVFERMKEELRAGRGLRAAAEAGFSRAWTSIRDSQVSTLIVCAVLYFFGTNFGASMVKGFALTLAIGTVINLFTAVVATRTFVRLLFHLAGDWLRSRRWLLGV
jgi:protein-export membrane protein SecD